MKRNHEKQKGAVMIMVTVIIAFSMLMLAFALDIGWILSTKSELQHGADSAALASVSKILTGNNDLVASDASVWAAFNKAATLDKQVLESVEVGYIHNPLDPESPFITDTESGSFHYYNTVRVKSSMKDIEDTDSHPLNLFMTAFTGEDKVDLGMYAYATIDSRVYAPSPPPGSPGDSSDGGSTWESSDASRSVFGDKLIPFTIREESFYPIYYTNKNGVPNDWWVINNDDFYNEDHPHGLFTHTGNIEDDPRNDTKYHYYSEVYDKFFTYEDRYDVNWEILKAYPTEDGGTINYYNEAEDVYEIPISADITLPITRTKDKTDSKVGDKVPELPLYLYDQNFVDYPDGNWGTVQFGKSMSGSKVEQQILNGVQPEDYYYVFNEPDEDGFYNEGVAVSDPGKNIGFMDAFNDDFGSGINAQDGALGKIRFLLLHTPDPDNSGGGANGSYKITGIVPVVIVDNIDLTKLSKDEHAYYEHYQGIKMSGETNQGKSGRYVIVQPLKAIPKLGSGDAYESSYDGGGITFYDPGAAFSPDAPPNDFIYTYALVR